MANVFFDEFVDPFAPGNVVIRAEHYMRYQFAKMYSREHGGKDLVVYDLGCGNGYGSRILAAAAKKVYGFDTSETLLPTDAHDSVDYFQLDVDRESLASLITPQHLPRPDIVVAFEFLEHIDRPLTLLQEIHTVLPDNGTLILSVPNERFEPKKNGKPKNTFHKHLFTTATVGLLLTEAGFTQIRSYGQPHANVFYHRARRVMPLLNHLSTFSPLFRLIAQSIASVKTNSSEQSYSMIFTCSK